MKLKDATIPGIYVMIGPEEEFADVEQNVFIVLANGEKMCGDAIIENEDIENTFEVELVAKASDYKALQCNIPY